MRSIAGFLGVLVSLSMFGCVAGGDPGPEGDELDAELGDAAGGLTYADPRPHGKALAARVFGPRPAVQALDLTRPCSSYAPPLHGNAVSLFCLVLAGVAALVALALAARIRGYWPIALLLTVGVAAEVAGLGLDAGVLVPLREELGVSVPWTGWARVAGHLSDALWLVWPAALVAAALVVFAGRKPWPAFVGWAAVVVALVLRHPIAGDGSLGRLLSAVHVLTAMASAGLFVAWARRPTRRPTPARLSLALIVGNELVSLLAAWWAGPFVRWNVAHLAAVLTFGVLILAQGRFLWATKVPSSSCC